MESSAIRSRIKAQRSALSADAVFESSVQITRLIWTLPYLSRARRIACYFPVGNEVDCNFMIEEALNRGREVFLPVLSGPELKFARYEQGCGFLRNFHGIPEPAVPKARLKKPREMDVVIAPLVAFDCTGNRIGMGGGYYDRSFRFLHTLTHWRRPKLIGIAHELQKVPKIKASSWDVPLHFAVTDKKSTGFSCKTRFITEIYCRKISGVVESVFR